MSTAINMFVKQMIRENRIPFTVGEPRFRDDVAQAIEEGRALARDSKSERYADMESFRKAIDEL